MKVLLKRNKQKGQAAVEFMICVVVIFFFLFFFLSLAVLLVSSEYMDYVTFMAARTYKAAYNNPEQQEINARRVFNAYATKIQGVARNFQLDLVKADPNDEQTAGVQSSYDIDLFYLPPVFIPGARQAARIRLSSEAHLGREPGFDECLDYFQRFVQRLGISGMDSLYVKMDDNGC